MMQGLPSISSSAPFGQRALCLVVATCAGLVLGLPSLAQVADTGSVVLVEAQTTNAETVRLLAGLARIRADLQLGMLALGEPSSAVHFTHAQAELLPGLRDGLAAAGVADLEPALQKLAAGGGKDALRKAYVEAEGALLKARSVLNPAAGDVVLAVLDLAKGAAAQIAASGPTEAGAYQQAWALLMAARGELDLLSRSGDPAMAKLAVAEGMAVDEVLISMPDPSQSGPVTFDPTPILDLIGRLEKMDEAA